MTAGERGGEAARSPSEGRDERTSGGFSRERLARMGRILAGHVERGAVPGIVALVHRRGETRALVLGRTRTGGGGEPLRRDAIFRIASVSKTISAVAALMLVEECVLRLDDPVDPLLPELAGRRVLERPDAPLEASAPARRAITLRDLLTQRMGLGAILRAPGETPIQRALEEAGLAAGPKLATIAPDEYMRRLGALPLVHHPGEGWLYHTSSDVLGVLLARAAGRPLGDLLRERIFEPLGMKDTAFQAPGERAARLPGHYRVVRSEAGRERLFSVDDDPASGPWTRPPVFESAGGGLVSTADDLLAFHRMLLGGGRLGAARLLSRPSVLALATDQLTPAQREEGRALLGDGQGWGLGTAVHLRRTPSASPGAFGWNGGYGTSAYVDPAEEMVGILLTQRQMENPTPPPVFQDFWTSAYAAIDD